MLATALAMDLGFPLLAKDVIKDALMTVIEVPDVASSRRVGGAAVAALLAVARDCPTAVIESVWHRSRAVDDLAALRAPLIEVFCRCDRAVARARYSARAGTRGAGHLVRVRQPDELWNDETSQPVMGGWPVLEVDTSGPVDTGAVADWARERLAGIGAAAVVRRASAADVAVLAAVHRETVTAAYAGIFPPGASVPTLAQLEADWAEAVEGRSSTVLVAESDGAIVGTVAATAVLAGDDPESGQVGRLHVVPGWWGAGLGSRLHDEALLVLRSRGCRRARLWVLEKNRRARAMYEGRGWRMVPGEALDRGGGVVEVRYQVDLDWLLPALPEDEIGSRRR
ncbi:MAG: hypothetical protein QOG64_639 [Acidimicrobiaceae bacterium]|nr:hypothetical protein [Acidimicrobiaceae bacterium]